MHKKTTYKPPQNLTSRKWSPNSTSTNAENESKAKTFPKPIVILSKYSKPNDNKTNAENEEQYPKTLKENNFKDENAAKPKLKENDQDKLKKSHFQDKKSKQNEKRKPQLLDSTNPLHNSKPLNPTDRSNIKRSPNQDLTEKAKSIIETTKADLQLTDNKKEALHTTTAKYQSNSRTKLVVRLLPPSMTEQSFFDSIEKAYFEHLTWRRYILGRPRETPEKPFRHSTCYLNFDSPQSAENFRKFYNGHTFIDDSHKTYKIIVCSSPYHKIPRIPEIIDKLTKTIEKDPMYITFLNSLASNTKVDVPNTAEIDTKFLTTDTGENVTPLLLAFHSMYGVETLISGKSYTPEDYQRDFNTASENYQLNNNTDSEKIHAPKSSQKVQKKIKSPSLNAHKLHKNKSKDKHEAQVDKLRQGTKNNSPNQEMKKDTNSHKQGQFTGEVKTS